MASVTKHELDLVSSRSFILPSTLIIDVFISPAFMGYNVEEAGKDDIQQANPDVHEGGKDDVLQPYNLVQESL